MARFVILRHEPGPTGPRSLHWDLMLEAGGVLRTFALVAPPDAAAAATLSAERLADHRLDWLDQAGEVSGGRGRVQRWDGGGLEWIADGPSRMAARLDGARLRGRVELTAAAEADAPQRWTLCWSPG